MRARGRGKDYSHTKNKTNKLSKHTIEMGNGSFSNQQEHKQNKTTVSVRQPRDVRITKTPRTLPWAFIDSSLNTRFFIPTLTKAREKGRVEKRGREGEE